MHEGSLTRIFQSLAHRGPDDEAILVNGNAGLAHRRLSIIDLSPEGRNPMPSEDASLWITHNGEVYNFLEHRDALIAKGHKFRSRTDTEVVLHLYEEYGSACVEELRGMFAFAIWDAKRRCLFLARDRFGIKPLYYSFTPQQFIFSSELPSLLLHPDVQREIDLSALNAYLTLGYVPSPHTLFKHIHKLPPAHTLTVQIGKDKLDLRGPVRYFQLRLNPDLQRSEEETVEQARTLLEESIKMHLISDVPVGAFLSGGVDSSAIVSVMTSVFNQPVKTFSIGFEDQRYSEISFARTIARKFGTDHYELILTPSLVQGAIDNAVRNLGEPLGDASALNNYFVSQIARQHVTVSLAGDGGDEAFGGYARYFGYGRYVSDWHLDVFGHLPGWKSLWVPVVKRLFPAQVDARVQMSRRVRSLVRLSALSPARRYLDRMTYFAYDERPHLYRRDFLEMVQGNDCFALLLQSVHGNSDKVDSALFRQLLDLLSYIPEDLMFKADRMSMCHSLEVRVPFLDHKLLEFAMTIPSKLNARGYDNRKVILKKAIANLVPAEVMYRPKQGFVLPYGEWLRGPWAALCKDTLLAESAWIYQYLNREYVRNLLSAHAQRRYGTDRRLWSLFALELWARQMQIAT